jgi:flagellar motor protein MotB
MQWTLPRLTRFALLATLAFTMTGLTGCATKRLQAERDALYTQNQELQDRLTQAQAAHDAAVADRERSAAEMARLQAELAAKEAAAKQAAARRPAQSRNNGFSRIANIESFENNGLLTVRVQGDVLFAPGKADLKASSRKTLSEIVGVLKKEYADNAIRIGGYTDSDPIRKSKWKNNEELSLARANAVRSYLREKGISASRLFAAGYGSTNPRSTKALSRRVEIVVVLNQGQK